MENEHTELDYPRGLTFEQVWAALMENRQIQKETSLQNNEPKEW
jgi:hypothetical protein